VFFVGALVAAVALWRVVSRQYRDPKRGRRSAIAGIVMGLLTASFPLTFMATAKRVPRIHDITTDTESPPNFEAVLPLRAQSPNPAEYGGREIAEQQLKAYPEIRPLVLDLSVEESFERALRVARDMGWEIVAGDPQRGRIEATATTPFFGFKDDVVVRLAPTDTGTRIDVRSVSRVGISDVGANAKRIRSFLAKLQKN
jgi:uncharacterized protein (DUF1499 family)